MIGSGEAAIQYPPHWLTKASPSDLAALGITWEADAPKVRPPKPLDDVKKELKDAISVQAENIRLQYVTAGSGKAMSYQEKLAEARLVLDDTAAAAALTAQEQQDTYPILASEIGVTAEGRGSPHKRDADGERSVVTICETSNKRASFESRGAREEAPTLRASDQYNHRGSQGACR
ncbi:MAG: hypothetical protein EB165_02735 [Euryarchaeota archaeon]|nr:hypothetical protein [Euryarchaeota archaeon]